MRTKEEERDFLGRIVRDAWVRWAKSQPNPKPSWLVPYDQLVESDKEADRQIAEAVALQLGVDRLMFHSDQLMSSLERQAARVAELESEVIRLKNESEQLTANLTKCRQEYQRLYDTGWAEQDDEQDKPDPSDDHQ